jgi:6-phosphogluconolactonase
MKPQEQTSVLYSAVDGKLTRYEVDVEAATLDQRESLELPAKVQYAWRHPSGKYLYVTTSNGGPHVRSDYNHVAALAIGNGGALERHGEPRPLARRAVHLCVDPTGRYTVNAHNFPTSGLTIHRIECDGSVGAEVEQPGGLDFGIYPHQVMIFPSGRTALIVDRGNKAQGDKAEQPGALRSFGFENGILSPGQVVAPNGGYGFGPRHVAFHPSKPWLYVSDERTNRLYMFRYANDRLEPEAAYVRDTLAEPQNVRPRQLGGPIHVHPNGRFVYMANRSDHTVEASGKKVFGGGENNIAVYAIDPVTGEPTLIQNAETYSFHVRTFACDPSGRLLVTASIKALPVQDGAGVSTVPAALSVFRIQQDGRLDFARKYDVATSASELQYWMGITSLR